MSNWVTITDHIRNGDMPPGPSQRWHFWCAAYHKKLVLHQTIADFEAWSAQVTKNYDQGDVTLPPTVSVEINGQQMYPGYEVHLSTHANLVFTTHDKPQDDGVLLSDFSLSGFHVTDDGTETERSPYTTKTRPATEEDEDQIHTVIDELEGKNAIGPALLPLWRDLTWALAYREADNLAYLQASLSPASAEIGSIFREDRKNAALIAFMATNIDMANDMNRWEFHLTPYDAAQLSESVHKHGGMALFEGFEKQATSLFYAHKVEYNTGAPATGRRLC